MMEMVIFLIDVGMDAVISEIEMHSENRITLSTIN